MLLFGVENRFTRACDMDWHEHRGSRRLRSSQRKAAAARNLHAKMGRLLCPLRKALVRDGFLNDKRVIMLVLDA
jgi:hypothetical protein